MTIVKYTLCLLITGISTWGVDWAWGVPLIVVTVVFHVWGLGIVRLQAFRATSYAVMRRHHRVMFVAIVGGMTLSATLLHVIEALLWSFTYRFFNVFPDQRSAMLYSLNALTSYGHENLHLDNPWQLMGAIESLNGWLLFGVSTAFLFTVIQKVSSSETN